MCLRLEMMRLVIAEKTGNIKGINSDTKCECGTRTGFLQKRGGSLSLPARFEAVLLLRHSC